MTRGPAHTATHSSNSPASGTRRAASSSSSPKAPDVVQQLLPGVAGRVDAPGSEHEFLQQTLTHRPRCLHDSDARRWSWRRSRSASRHCRRRFGGSRYRRSPFGSHEFGAPAPLPSWFVAGLCRRGRLVRDCRGARESSCSSTGWYHAIVVGGRCDARGRRRRRSRRRRRLGPREHARSPRGARRGRARASRSSRSRARSTRSTCCSTAIPRCTSRPGARSRAPTSSDRRRTSARSRARRSATRRALPAELLPDAPGAARAGLVGRRQSRDAPRRAVARRARTARVLRARVARPRCRGSGSSRSLILAIEPLQLWFAPRRVLGARRASRRPRRALAVPRGASTTGSWGVALVSGLVVASSGLARGRRARDHRRGRARRRGRVGPVRRRRDACCRRGGSSFAFGCALLVAVLLGARLHASHRARLRRFAGCGSTRSSSPRSLPRPSAWSGSSSSIACVPASVIGSRRGGISSRPRSRRAPRSSCGRTSAARTGTRSPGRGSGPGAERRRCAGRSTNGTTAVRCTGSRPTSASSGSSSRSSAS